MIKIRNVVTVMTSRGVLLNIYTSRKRFHLVFMMVVWHLEINYS